MSEPAGGVDDALERIAGVLERDPELSPWVALAPDAPAPLAPLMAGGSRTREEPGAYALVVEAVLEGHLLHRGRSRLVPGADADLALLAGDYLYALGIERLAHLDDPDAVSVLAQTITGCARLGTERRDEIVWELWAAAACAVGWGARERFEAALEACLEDGGDGAGKLAQLAAELSGEPLDGEALGTIRETVGFHSR